MGNEEEVIAGNAATVDAWIARGDHRFDPVRFRFIEALARRADTHEGEARRLLDERVAALLAAYGKAMEDARAAKPQDNTPAVPRRERGALAELVEHAAQNSPLPVGMTAVPADATPGASPALELKTLRYFRSTWSKLSADLRLTQSLAKVPENAGPLNSHHLVHRALSLMRDLSPEYLNHFMSYVDTLSWVEQAKQSANAPAAAGNARGEGAARKTTRAGKAG
ncbi:DUF2894 domain-containing protein [Variovorax sp. E3]|uniref:DUF2894 domain-containing protein n=1 Tax=Variovorax sp. E3 TaxID=1914993 RepID=UPI0027DD2F21|nr:DUF2894 domain-containing protein [Variovorax sp. E3]